MSASDTPPSPAWAPSLPPRLVPNSWFETIVETSDEWIRERTGIEARHFADDDVQTLRPRRRGRTRRARRPPAIAPEQLDLIVCATITGDTPIPATAVWMQTQARGRRARRST